MDKYENACLTGDIETIKYWFRYESKKFKYPYFLNRCLENACKGNHVDIFTIIITYMDKHFCEDKISYGSIIECAIKCRNTNILKILLNNKRKIEWLNCLTSACNEGWTNIFFKYVNLHIEDITQRYRIKYMWDTYMSHSCSSGNILIVNYCIKKGADVWNEGLMHACAGGNMAIVELMISKGANDWNAGLYNAFSKKNNTKIIELMISKGANNFDWCMYNACLYGQDQYIDFIIKQGVTNWNHGLIGACKNGHIDLVKLMISKGATIFNLGLNSACNRGIIEIVNLLIQHGATNFDECLGVACRHRNLEIINLLIDRGATDWDGGLKSACRIGNEVVVKMMLLNGATNLNECMEINSQTINNMEINNMLIAGGADNLDPLRSATNLKMYRLYCRYKGKIMDNDKYLKLLLEHPQYILLICASKTDSTINRLPVDIIRLMFWF